MVKQARSVRRNLLLLAGVSIALGGSAGLARGAMPTQDEGPWSVLIKSPPSVKDPVFGAAKAPRAVEAIDPYTSAPLKIANRVGGEITPGAVQDPEGFRRARTIDTQDPWTSGTLVRATPSLRDEFGNAAPSSEPGFAK